MKELWSGAVPEEKRKFEPETADYRVTSAEVT
jgi:hypothetical protein